MGNNDPIIQLKKEIASAFPTSKLIPHEGCIELRTKLVALYDEDIFDVLGTVLIDLLETSATSTAPADWFCSDSVIRFLCGANSPPVEAIPGLASVAKQLNEFALEQKSQSERLFRKFTTKQAQAIYHWLQWAQSWDEINFSADELAAALEYWKPKNQPPV